jgi:hypothetical protein
VDIARARGELVEAELDRFIATRSRKKDPDEEHEATGEIPPERGLAARMRRFVGGRR